MESEWAFSFCLRSRVKSVVFCLYQTFHDYYMTLGLARNHGPVTWRACLK